MRLFRCILVPVLSGLAISSFGFANVFSEADDLFFQRDNGFSTATRAREAYSRVLEGNLTDDQKIYAVTQIGRLDIYRGSMIDGVENRVVKDVFDDCLDSVKKIEDTESQAYYYYHLACVAFRGKASSSFGRLKWALKLKSAQEDALESLNQGVAVEGGGILRVLSAVRGNRQAKPLGLYNPEEALSFAERALSTPTVEVRPYPNELGGSDYHENYFFYAQAQLSLAIEREDRSVAEKALETIEEAIETLDDLEDLEELPKGREPETKWYKGEMVKMESMMRECMNSGEKWRSCCIKGVS